MKKIKMMGFMFIIAALVSGCSCAKVDENTYGDAVSTYKNTDAIYFTRIETVSTEDETIYTRKKIEAKYVFDTNNNVAKMEYSRTISEISNAGVNLSTPKVVKYYYSNERNALYSYLSSVERYKESNVTYDSKFNNYVCEDSFCYMMIKGDFAPVFNLDEVSGFNIEKDENKAVATFKAICPSYESCASSSQMLDYTYVINEYGNIESISYDIVKDNTTYSIRYTFHSFGSNNVKVIFPDDLETYNEK